MCVPIHWHIFPVPQNASQVSAGTNDVKFPKGSAPKGRTEVRGTGVISDRG